MYYHSRIYRLVVFVSSQMNELRYEREAAAEVIHELNQEPLLFELLPAMSESPWHASIEGVEDSDMMVLILGCRDSDPTLLEYKAAVANHIPIIVLVRSTNEKRDKEVARLIAEFEGRDNSSGTPRLVYKTYERLSQFKSELKQALAYEIGKALRPPLYTLTREEMYDLSSRMIERSEWRLGVVQRTPSLFLGARPYGSSPDQTWPYEQRFLDALEGWIKRAAKERKGDLVYAYSAEDTRRCLEDTHGGNADNLARQVEEKVKYYKGIEEDSKYHLCFQSLVSTFSGPLVVGDNRVGFWLLGEHNAVSIHQENRQIANAIMRMLPVHTKARLTGGAAWEEIRPQKAV